MIDPVPGLPAHRPRYRNLPRTRLFVISIPCADETWDAHWSAPEPVVTDFMMWKNLKAYPGIDISEVALVGSLDRDELLQVMKFFNTCLVCRSEDELSGALRDYAARLGYEFVFCAYVPGNWDRHQIPRMINISNPPDWLAEYATSGFMANDPVLAEAERRLAAKSECGVIEWDVGDAQLTDIQQKMLERRRSFGLEFGFSAYCHSFRQESSLMVSMASRTMRDGRKAQYMTQLVVAHINRCLKRLDLQSRVGRLTERENDVAKWLVEGKTNWEIAQILEVSESTVKFHVLNILEKIGARNRQNAVSILIAERFMS